MKTLIIYNDLEEMPQYAIVEGDYSNCDGAVINCNSTDKEDCAIDLLFDINGKFKIDLSSNKNIVENKEWDKVSVIIFVP